MMEKDIIEAYASIQPTQAEKAEMLNKILSAVHETEYEKTEKENET